MDHTSLDFEWRATVERIETIRAPIKQPTLPVTFDELLASVINQQEVMVCE